MRGYDPDHKNGLDVNHQKNCFQSFIGMTGRASFGIVNKIVHNDYPHRPAAGMGCHPVNSGKRPGYLYRGGRSALLLPD